MLLSPFIEWLVIDMIAETSATKNNLSCDTVRQEILTEEKFDESTLLHH